MIYQGVKRRVFISHFREDRDEVNAFIQRFVNVEKVFTPYVLGANNNDNFINSTNPEYVMTQIREKYLQNSTVTIVLVGTCTHSRRYIDWELKSSLRRGENITPNGVMAILLPSQGNSSYLPPRFLENYNENVDCYARYYAYPKSADQLGQWIDDAHNARIKRADLIKNNSQDMMKYNSKCKVCEITH